MKKALFAAALTAAALGFSSVVMAEGAEGDNRTRPGPDQQHMQRQPAVPFPGARGPLGRALRADPTRRNGNDGYDARNGNQGGYQGRGGYDGRNDYQGGYQGGGYDGRNGYQGGYQGGGYEGRNGYQGGYDGRNGYQGGYQGRGGYDGRGAGPGHNFYRGGRLPQEYRNRQYVVDDWRGHHLNAPPRGYQWVQTGGDYVLVAIATGIIAQILLSQ